MQYEPINETINETINELINDTINITRDSSSSSISTNSDYENYIIKANVCKILSDELGLKEYKFDISDYEPPKEPGLQNCDLIIPSYYHLHKHPEKLFKIDYYEIIKDDIRNFRKLNQFQMEYIKQLPDEYKNELLDIFNLCLDSFAQIVSESN